MFHVAGVLVHARPGRAAELRERIAGIEGATVHAVSADGKLVVTLESDRSEAIAERLADLQRLSGVNSAVLVSEYNEPLPDADEVMPHAPEPEDPT